jgi:hypothetical protein
MAKQYSKTKKAFETGLNELYFSYYSESQALDVFSYLGSELVVRNNYYRRSLGTLLRKKDPIGFEVGYSEWKKRS